jgi:predicted GIY-YIG superfamily endonuclease
MYCLWEREQVVVLLSRTPTAAGTIFIGDPETTIDTLVFTLQRITQFTMYICALLTAFTEQTDASAIEIDLAIHPFRPIDVPLPMDHTGSVYLLVSCQNTDVTYIGETGFLPKRIDYHNSGYGAEQTASANLRPWAILAYVVGFEGNIKKRKEFEKEWEYERDSEIQRLNRRLLPDEIANLALKQMLRRKQTFPNEDLRFVRAGIVSGLPPSAATDGPSIFNKFETSNQETPIKPARSSEQAYEVPMKNVREKQPHVPYNSSSAEPCRINPKFLPRVRTVVDDDDDDSSNDDSGIATSVKHDQPVNIARSDSLPLHRFINDLDMWGFMDKMTPSEAIQNLRENVWLNSYLMDLFGISISQSSPTVQYV